LNQKDETMKKMELMINKEIGPAELNAEIITLQKQKESLEQMLAVKDADLQATEHRLSAAINHGGIYEFKIENSESKKELESELKAERDRTGKLLSKLDEIDFMNKQLTYKLEAMRNPRGNNDQLSMQYVELQSYNDEVVYLVTQFLHSLLNVGSDYSEKSNRLTISKLKSQLSRVFEELLYARGLIPRLLLFRSNLTFQKAYLLLQVEDLEQSAKTTLAIMSKMGLDVTTFNQKSTCRPIMKFKKAVITVLTIIKMKIMSKRWSQTIKSTRFVKFDKLPQLYQETSPIIKKVDQLQISRRGNYDF
jgi:hypothetical protein